MKVTNIRDNSHGPLKDFSHSRRKNSMGNVYDGMEIINIIFMCDCCINAGCVWSIGDSLIL